VLTLLNSFLEAPDGKLPETIETKDHLWLIGTQFHPELKSRPFEPPPLLPDSLKLLLSKAGLFSACAAAIISLLPHGKLSPFIIA